MSRVVGHLNDIHGNPQDITTGDVVDTTGIVTLFTFYVPPTLSVQFEPEGLVLRWGPEPLNYQVQFSESPDATSGWIEYDGSIERGPNGERKVVLPFAASDPRRYYRLFYPSVPMLPPAPPLPVPGEAPAAPSTDNGPPLSRMMLSRKSQ